MYVVFSRQLEVSYTWQKIKYDVKPGIAVNPANNAHHQINFIQPH